MQHVAKTFKAFIHWMWNNKRYKKNKNTVRRYVVLARRFTLVETGIRDREKFVKSFNRRRFD